MHTIAITVDTILPRLTAQGRTALSDADIVLAVDNRSQQEYTVFGTPALEGTISMKSLSAMHIARILFDYDCQQLEELTAIVRSVKGLDPHHTATGTAEQHS